MMNLPTYWRSAVGDILSENALVERIICSPDHRIIALDGYYDWQQGQVICRLKECFAGTVFVLTAEMLGEEIIAACNHPGNMQESLWTTLRSVGNILCFEDIELFHGKHVTNEVLIQCFSSISEDMKIILTGSQLSLLVPELVGRLACTYYKLCGDHMRSK